MHFIQEQFLFLLSIAFVLFIPGLVLLRGFFKHLFTSLEIAIFSLPLSIAITNFLIIILGQSHIKITATSISVILSVFSLGAAIIAWILHRKHPKEAALPTHIKAFTQRQGWIIILILTLTLFIKTLYLSSVILPTATDLGHHMYWSKLITVTGELPVYEERNIIQTDGVYKLDAPEPIDDFIIGEHLVFSAIALLAGLDFISGFPASVLLLINMFSLLVIFVVTLRIFSSTSFLQNKNFATSIAIMTLFILGPLYTLASPQAKFVSGGVIGNTFGNLFIPITLYMYWRALQEKNSVLLTLAFFLTFGLAYIHHLTTLVFLFIMFFAIVSFSLFHFKTLRTHISEWLKLFLKPAPIIFAVSAILFFFFVLAPSYADPKSLNTAIGAPTKATRTGLTFLQLTFSTGEGRLGLGLIGLLSLLFFQFRTHIKTKEVSYDIAFLFAWGFSLLIMSLRPQWLFLDIPSNRISTYAIFPFAILSAFAFVQLFTVNKHTPHRNILSSSAFIILLTFLITGGFYDNSQSLLAKTKTQEAIETYRVADYLASHNKPTDIILKDHNYIVADSWMKLSFLQGYTYPLSRGYFKRYEDATKPREQCTLWMIAVPNSDKGKKCFEETGTNIVVVNAHFDNAQFKKSDNFTSIYQSNNISVYMRK